MIVAVLWQFGFGVLALLIRFSENACWLCLTRCGRCCRGCGRCACKCLACVFSCCGVQARVTRVHDSCSGPCAAVFNSVAWVLSHIKLRWYWLMLANNVAFMIREFAVISLLDGWYKEVVVANVATWLALVLVLWEVWRFSTERPRAPKTVDQVLDMVLLPLNYGMFCALCVRILKLQNTDENQEMVTAVIDSADIWEAWALWSVLELFVLVVDTAAKRDQRRTDDAQHLETIKIFKNLSLSGVKLFVLILVAFISLDILVKGVIAPAVPTFCYWFYKDCMSCHDWYHLHVNPVAQSIIYIMCSFALIFVFTFERMFSEYLHCIQPYWKFWGVKLVVSVTYFQWLVISYCFGLSNAQIYLLHCLGCCMEMPMLAVLHATCAYPYGKAWLEHLLDHVPSARPEETQSDNTSDDPESANAEELPATTFGDPLPSAANPCGEHSTEEAASLRPYGRDVIESRQRCWCCSLVLYFTVWSCCCYGATRLIFTVVPPEYEINDQGPMYNFMCNQQELGKFVEEQSDKHWVLPAKSEGQLRIPGTAGAWLPLCGKTVVDCAIGYRGNPSLKCTSHGEYAWHGVCEVVSCGPPIRIPHATPQYDHQAWTTGMKVKYRCRKGYRGNPIATCGENGNYTYEGSCTEIVCDTPPPVPHATTPDHKGEWKEGMEVRYQCDTGYNGKPTGLCGHDEVWTVRGHCTVTCGTPPVVPYATPKFDLNSTHDWSIGSRLKYKCATGYGGSPVAICNETGHFQVEGGCDRVCAHPMDIAHAIARIDVHDLRQDWKVGSRVAYVCDPGYGGDPIATCGPNGRWNFSEPDKCSYMGCGPLERFMSNKSSSWASRMVIKKKLNFTRSDYGDEIFFACNKGYSGRPIATCLGGKWQLEGDCTVACDPPPAIAHALPSFNMTAEAMVGWKSGMQVTYRCDVGFGGAPACKCNPHGRWEFAETTQCLDLGCGSLDEFLSRTSSSWHHKMHIQDQINFTASEYGDVVLFQCHSGYVGKPIAICANRHWRLTDECSPFGTSRDGAIMGCAGVVATVFFYYLYRFAKMYRRRQLARSNAAMELHTPEVSPNLAEIPTSTTQ